MSISHVGSPEEIDALSEEDKRTLFDEAQRDMQTASANIGKMPSPRACDENAASYQRYLLTAADRLRINYAGSNLLSALYDGRIEFASHREAAIVHVLDVLWNDRAKTDRREAISVLERAAGVTW